MRSTAGCATRGAPPAPERGHHRHHIPLGHGLRHKRLLRGPHQLLRRLQRLQRPQEPPAPPAERHPCPAADADGADGAAAAAAVGAGHGGEVAAGEDGADHAVDVDEDLGPVRDAARKAETAVSFC